MQGASLLVLRKLNYEPQHVFATHSVSLQMFYFPFKLSERQACAHLLAPLAASSTNRVEKSAQWPMLPNLFVLSRPNRSVDKNKAD